AIAAAPFGKVSVVIMACAALIQLPGAAAATSSFITPLNLLASSGSPITPVDARNTCGGAQVAARPTMSAESFVAARPDFPVKALALPELTKSAAARPALT